MLENNAFGLLYCCESTLESGTHVGGEVAIVSVRCSVSQSCILIIIIKTTTKNNTTHLKVGLHRGQHMLALPADPLDLSWVKVRQGHRRIGRRVHQLPTTNNKGRGNRQRRSGGKIKG